MISTVFRSVTQRSIELSALSERFHSPNGVFHFYLPPFQTGTFKEIALLTLLRVPGVNFDPRGAICIIIFLIG